MTFWGSFGTLYRDNDPTDKLIEYWMKVHSFENTPFLAVAMFGLHKKVKNADDYVKSYVLKYFN